MGQIGESMIRMTVYAGESSGSDPYKPSVRTIVVEESQVHEELRRLGLEWKQADYFPTRQTVITFDPVPNENEANVKDLVREAATILERTGLL
jgi:hypothetical protein